MTTLDQQSELAAAMPKILAAALAGSIRVESKGGGSWAPVRGAGDWSAWGRWECWEHARFGERADGFVGPIVTGDWIAWDSATGQILGFPTRAEAEMMAVLQNENARTRIVPLCTAPFVSKLDFDAVQARVDAELERMAETPA